ncbi:MAG: hypothetical protein LKJ25_01075 [Clostridia bacterium]|jgi:hypothetical protein|nr:hypothetical protein [Clostridia bacterium]
MDSIRKRDYNLSEYNISRYAYRELEYFCLQYREKKRRLSHLRITNRESYEGEKTILENDIKMIETSAYEADNILCHYIIKNVADGIVYERQNVPCGRRQFYEIRRLFFFNLFKKRNLSKEKKI